eukprot:gene8084-16589_t
MKRFKDPPTLPLTGTSTRMKTLPHVNISSIESHRTIIAEPMRANPIQTSFKPTNTENRKCIYSYEDKYTFARILQSDSLVFDSHFESGNLQSAYRILPTSDVNAPNDTRLIYDLYINHDITKQGHTQWFYFSVSNTKANQEVVFCLKNFEKPTSLFQDGMRPLVYSIKSEVGWVRGGNEVSYTSTGSTDPTRTDKRRNKIAHCLSF